MIMIKEITRLAPAKINLYLEITSKRADGYHDIESIMQTVSLYDKLTFTVHDTDEKKRITVTCTDPSIPCDSRNLVFRAAELLFDEANIKSYDLSIHLEKHIPSAAGLGGGSSDAAATILAINELYGLHMDEKRLCTIGARLGADIPFCIVGGTAITRGIGDIIEPCAGMPDCHIVIACAGEGVSTPWAYKRLDEMYDFPRRKSDVDGYEKLLEDGDLKAVADGMTNIFEDSVLPERETARMIRDTMSCSGALRAMMSGSGPSIVGICDSREAAQKAAEKLFEKGVTAHICKPCYQKTG